MPCECHNMSSEVRHMWFSQYPLGVRPFLFCVWLENEIGRTLWKRAIMNKDLLPYTELSVQRNTFRRSRLCEKFTES